MGWIHATAFNGACSTTFCGRLLAALRYAAAQDTSAIALVGGRAAWNNGIHLGVIEAAKPSRQRTVHYRAYINSRVAHARSCPGG